MTTLAFAGWESGSGTGREGRESYAKNAKENQKIQKNFLWRAIAIANAGFKIHSIYSVFISSFSFFSPLSRLSRNFRAFRGRKPAFAPMTTSHPSTGRAAQ
jgi:hypothetical protein